MNILSRLAASLLGEHFRVADTTALYASEAAAAASITFDADAVATRDIDLL